MSNEQTFNIDGIQFVSGLFWQPLTSSNNGERNKEVRGLSKELGFDLHVLRTTNSYCVGFCKTDSRLKIKMGVMSAAAAVSKTLEIEGGHRDFIFISQLKTGKWLYVAQKDGIILHDGDNIFDTEEEIKNKYLDDSSIGDWSALFLPASWQVKGSVDRDFESMLQKRGGKYRSYKWWRLMPVSHSRSITLYKGKILVVGVLVAAGLYGVSYYKKLKLQKLAQETAILQAIADREANKKLPPPEHPWKKVPMATDTLNACLDALSHVRLFPGNWDINVITCNGSTLTVSWKPRAYGWIQHLKEIEPDAFISLDGSTASVSTPIKELKVGFDEPVENKNVRLIEMYSAAQRYGVKFVATPAAPPPPPLPGQAQSNVPAQEWSEINWKADDIAFPETVLAALDGKGFRLKTMTGTWNQGKFIWTMEGIQYAQP